MIEYLMNKKTGTVDTLESWGDDYLESGFTMTENDQGDSYEAGLSWDQWSEHLVQVKKDETGKWVEC